MRIRSILLVGTGLVSMALLLSLGSANEAYAVDIILDATTCTTLPGGGTMWIPATFTCSKTSGQHLAIASGDTLTIPSGVTLEMAVTNRDIQNVGTLTNNGAITFTTNRDIRNDGTLTNNGIITFTVGGDINNRNSGDFTNTGTITLTTASGNTGRITNQGTAVFTNTDTGSITFDGVVGNNNNRAQLRNQGFASFSNFGTITIDGTTNNSGQLRNSADAVFSNSGTITIEGTNDNSGRLQNQNRAVFSNSGTIVLMSTTENSGWVINQNFASLTNSGTITVEGNSLNSGQLRNQNSASIKNSGKITLEGVNPGMSDVSGLVRNFSELTNSGFFSTNFEFNNNNANSVLINSGTVQVSFELSNNNGLIINNCGKITFGTFSGNSIQEESIIICNAVSRTGYEDPTIGKSHSGKQVVKDGICIDIKCWTVTADFHQDFELVELLSDSTHTISTTVFCQNGVNRCNYVAFGVSPYGTNINDSVWKVILQKDHRDNWTMKVIDDDGFLGEVTSATQIVNNQYLSASTTIDFKKPTPGMILNIEVRDSKGGYRDFKFNDGILIVDTYAYPSIQTSYEPALEIEPLCLNENPNKRYTCAFDKIRDWTIKNAEKTLSELD